MRKNNLILSLWMLLILLIMLSTCCDELKEAYKPKIELQASYRMDEHGNLVKVYEKEP